MRRNSTAFHFALLLLPLELMVSQTTQVQAAGQAKSKSPQESRDSFRNLLIDGPAKSLMLSSTEVMATARTKLNPGELRFKRIEYLGHLRIAQVFRSGNLLQALSNRLQWDVDHNRLGRLRIDALSASAGILRLERANNNLFAFMVQRVFPYARQYDHVGWILASSVGKISEREYAGDLARAKDLESLARKYALAGYALLKSLSSEPPADAPKIIAAAQEFLKDSKDAAELSAKYFQKVFDDIQRESTTPKVIPATPTR